VVTVTGVIVVLTTPPPHPIFTISEGQNHFQRLSFTFETFGKKFAETKIVAMVNVKKIKAKNIEKRLLYRPR
jgi:hypothetical protein